MTDNPHDFALYLNDNLSEVDLDEALAALSPQRREQAMKFKRPQGRLLSAVAYGLLCRGLRERYAISELPELGYAEGGKPFIVGHEHIHFNMSHCREAALCALSDKPVGVDVESIGRYNESLVRYTMNDDELAQIQQSDRPDVAFIRLWTQKEAVLKLSGTGITDNMRTVLAAAAPPLATAAPAVLAAPGVASLALDGSHVKLATFINEDKQYIYSIATP
jgi:4'-phosphopantetheinyl transferase